MKCKKEQKIAYNVLFSDCHINEMSLEQTLRHIDRKSGDLEAKKFNVSLIKQCVTKNFDSYKQHPFIATSYEEIAAKLPL